MKQVLLLACCLLASACLGEDRNLLKNPGFEEIDNESRPVGWNLPADVFSVDTQVAHSGKNSLRIRNADPAIYRLATQPIPVEPERFYQMSVWVKTENVEGKETGATLCMEWTGEKGWLGGSYPAGIKGTQDWKKLVADTSTIPPEAKVVQFVLYLRQGMTGTAWFDDACVTPRYPSPLSSFLISPTYRGYLWPGAKPQPVRIRAAIGKPLVEDLALSEVRLSVNDKPIKIDPRRQETVVTIDPRTLKPGENSITLSLDVPAKGRTLSRKTYSVRKLRPNDKLPIVYIDPFNRAIVDGKPFFPLGLYFGSGPQGDGPIADLDTLAKSPFNCLMNYGVTGGTLEDLHKYLYAVEARKLKIIFSLKDVFEGTDYYPRRLDRFEGEKAIVEGLVNEFKNHAALLAWYTNDELPPSFISRLEERQQEMVRLDPDHPTWEVLYQVDDLRQYLNTTDILGTDPYPIPETPITHVTDYVKKTVDAVERHRAVWMVPQCMNWSVYRPGQKPVRGPTHEEMRNMTFQCLVGGATGLIYYSFFDLKRDPLGFDKPWSDLCRVGAEVKSLFPFLLSAETPPTVVLRQPSDSVLLATRQYAGKKVLIAVNVSREQQQVTFVLPGNPKDLHRLNETGDIYLKGDQITDAFTPVAVHVYEWE